MGIYICVCCEHPLFTSDTKFDSGSGWPSFWQQVNPNAINKKEDNTLQMTRIEITCAKCNSHLGHIFDDGPGPTGKRYCTAPTTNMAIVMFPATIVIHPIMNEKNLP